ncbi:class I SAM-dependent methyltransferase [Thermoleptolyngbya sp. M55_K2018_002]|uniref:class I SAM-dependent methyltransferase n=1 Tax=Thermoleptolyngbya sp. M55_K2018_002 TaxID=2747808 RepID=UPI0019E49692|nr:class I SAM-dependent methyltransferase [Thermoleptolyngbya sp. M55_K2018_002]HIK42219.1 class I SAM-dependent methyltransferase [Thermoleptolyngbya sp. M55_K2018_002]
MPVRNDTIFERFLAPVVKTFLIDRDAILRYYQSRDWQQESDRLRNPAVEYPSYYSSQNFHSIEGGYLSVEAALSYDPITQYALPPNETWVRKALLERVQGNPRRILDLGCGTGTSTRMLKRAFPQAEVIGLDLSPYMLAVAEDKAKGDSRSDPYGNRLDIQFVHQNAEQTGFPDASFDLVTATLLFHETPPEVAQTILREAFRLLTVGGQVLVLDGNQSVIRQTEWLTEIFEEPYIKAYAAGSVDAWMGKAGFGAVQTDSLWVIHQITQGVKPLPGQQVRSVEFATPLGEGDRQWAWNWGGETVRGG